MNAIKDLRDWIERLSKENDLWVLEDEVSPEPDIGAIGKAVCDIQGPAALIKNVKGYKIPVAIGMHAAWRREAKALGLPADASHDEITEAWREGFARYPVKNLEKTNGPCKENVSKGDAVNLFNLPLHRINQGDGSFYISKGNVITKDPDTGKVNVGIYRMMVLDKNRTALLMNYNQHGARHLIRSEELGKPLEVAVAIGGDPILPMVAGAKIPYEWSEYECAGAIRNSSYEITQAGTVDLPVPANSEIVLEGYLPPGERVFEGQFGEFPGAYTGYYYTPVFKINAMTYRNDPIYESLYIGRPNTENTYMTMHSKLSAVLHELKKVVPKVTRISYLKPYTHTAVIQGRWLHTADPKQAIMAFWGSSYGSYAKITIAVDEDVDPWSAEDVLWAVSTRVASSDDVIFVPHTYSPLSPSAISGVATKIGIDATKPRPPYLRYHPVDWVEAPKGTEEWKKKILNFQGGLN
ncbi:MAG: UbiD family decarboxylase [Thaumarchaeota archaeon]|nr:UbiD family decarboxylase [Nitrososphaerota archaeon]